VRHRGPSTRDLRQDVEFAPDWPSDYQLLSSYAPSMAAVRRAMPRNQYACSTCGGRHVYGSQRGRECGSQGHGVTQVARGKWGSRDAGRQPSWPAAPRTPYPSKPTMPAERAARPPHARPHPRNRSRETIERRLSTVSTHTLTYVFDRDAFYETLAKQLLDARPLIRRWTPGHWLCRQLDETARGLDPGTYTRQAQRPIREGLRSLGFPDFIATVLGAGAGVGLNIAVGQTPMGKLVTALRVLGALVCPNLSACPARNEVVKAFAAPSLAGELKSMEPTLRAHP
jgi:hypothetical protein